MRPLPGTELRSEDRTLAGFIMQPRKRFDEKNFTLL